MAGAWLSCTAALVRRNTLFIIFSLFLIFLGILFVAYGAKNYESKETEHKQENTKDKLGVVIDAGGSGTRLIIYRYSTDTGMMRQLYTDKCEDEGLGTYSKDQRPALKETLSKCFNKAAKNLPTNKVIPLYLGATAGMRLLKLRNETVEKEIWSLLNNTLNDSPFKILKSQTITGNEEARWAWVAANYIKNTIKANTSKYGIIDFGSSSIQLSFSLKNKIPGKNDVSTVTVGGQKITLYGHSYLCFGKREMERRFLAKLVTNAAYSSKVENPCYFSGYEKNYTSAYLWEAPCSSGSYAKNTLGQELPGPKDKTPTTYLLQGTGNATQCLNLLKPLIKLTCTQSSCGMNDVFQPGVQGNFLALTVFQYASSFMGLSSTANRTVFQKAMKDTCATTWGDIKARDIPGTPVKYRGSRCFDAVYSYFLLTDGFKFDDATWDLEYVNKINNEKVQWSLGLMYSEKENMYTTVKQYVLQTITRRPGLLGLLAFGVILLIIGFIILILACKARQKEQHTPISNT